MNNTQFIAIIICILTALGCRAEELYAPVPAPMVPIEHTKFQKNIDLSTDILLVAMPVAVLTGAIIEHDWEGIKQGCFTAVTAVGATYILKYSVREQRPDRTDYNSFPSGHTTAAFATAAFVQRRYGWKLGIPAYALATYTGVGRILARKHHWWDVVAGAAIGAGAAYIFTTPWAREHEFALAPGAVGDGMGVTASMTF